MVVRVETPSNASARTTAGPVSRAPAIAMPRAGATSYSREYIEYWAPLLQDDGETER